MNEPKTARLLGGSDEDFMRSYELFRNQPIDWDLYGEALPTPATLQSTISKPGTVSGRGTFLGKATRTLHLEPSRFEGWWFDRTDLPKSLPIKVSARNVWTTGSVVSNIVLRSGKPENYMRMVEHIIALKMGMGIDNLVIKTDSGDPPIFDVGSMPLVEALEEAGIEDQDAPARYYSVKEPVYITGPNGSFLVINPDEGKKQLFIDCAVDFPTAIKKQRIRFPMTYGYFRHGAHARTNTSLVKIIYSFTIGRLFADIRNMGYNFSNVLVASRFGYLNEAKLVHEGKSLEAVWHRSALDLLAALALLEEGRFVGEVISYKAGHWLDVQLMRELYANDLIEEVTD